MRLQGDGWGNYTIAESVQILTGLWIHLVAAFQGLQEYMREFGHDTRRWR